MPTSNGRCIDLIQNQKESDERSGPSWWPTWPDSSSSLTVSVTHSHYKSQWDRFENENVLCCDLQSTDVCRGQNHSGWHYWHSDLCVQLKSQKGFRLNYGFDPGFCSFWHMATVWNSFSLWVKMETENSSECLKWMSTICLLLSVRSSWESKKISPVVFMPGVI